MSPSVLIVGAGPAGLVLALTLLRNGVSVRIVEKNGSIPIGQRGAGIMPRTLEMYKFLKILSQVEPKCSPIKSMIMYTSPEGDGPVKEISGYQKEGEKPQYFRVNACVFGQDEHQTLLTEIIEKEYPGTRVEYSTELTTFEQNDDHVVVHLYNSKNGQTEEAKVSYLVGADGARSVVRKGLGLTFLGDTFADNAMVIGDVELLKGYDPEHGKIWGTMGDKMLILRSYKRDGKDFAWCGLGGANVDLEKAAIDTEYFVNMLYEVIGKRNLEFGKARVVQAWRANVRMVDKFGEGRVFVTGDAGHVHSPTGGQGLNSGVQDSMNLGWKLALVSKSLAPQSLLDSYTNERIPVIASMLNKTTELMHTAFSKSRSVGAWHWSRETELRQFGINYRGSELLVDERHIATDEEVVDPYRSGDDGAVRAGDRAPNAPGLTGGEGVTQLFDLFDMTSHTVVMFEASSTTAARKEVVDAVSAYPAGLVKVVTVYPKGTKPLSVGEDDLTFIDGEGYGRTFYKVNDGEGIIVIVRPDGYIGAVARGMDGLKQYFQKILIRI